MRQPGEPIPAEAFALAMDRIMVSNGDEWDAEPEWGLMYPPPLGIVAKVAREHGHDAAEMEGVLAASMPVPPGMWHLAGDPMVVLGSFKSVLANPQSQMEKKLSDYMREGRPAPAMGAFFFCEAFAPPERLREEAERRQKTGEEAIRYADLPDREECRIVWAVDVWGRNFLTRQLRSTGECSFAHDHGTGEYLHTSQEAIRILREILDAVTVPMPTV